MLGFMNIILVSLCKMIALPIIYYFKKILNVLLVICTRPDWFHMHLILHPLYFIIHQFSHKIELSFDGNKIGFNILDDKYFTIPYVIDTIQNLSAGHQALTQALSMEKNPPQIKSCLINSIAIRLDLENTRSISVYAEEGATREHILKIFGPDLIKSDQ